MCSDERRTEIDEKLCRNVANSHLALEYGFTERQVGLHKKNHVSPVLAAAAQAMQTQLVAEVAEFRSEAHYPPLLKARFMQDKLLTELDSADETEQRIAIIKEFRGWNIEEAKLTGAYTKEQENSKTTEQVLGWFNDWLNKNPLSTPSEKAEAIAQFARGGQIDPKVLAERIGLPLITEISQ